MKHIRADIIVQRTDGKWAKIHTNWDNLNPSNGEVLFEEYTTQEKVEKLVALGNLYSLGPEIGHRVDVLYKGRMYDENGHITDGYFQHLAKQKAQCVAYGRDGGLRVVTVVGETLAELWPQCEQRTEIVYYWHNPDGRGPRWFVSHPDFAKWAFNLGTWLMNGRTLDSTDAEKARLE